MFPGFFIKGLTLAVGYVYPGYLCFKALRKRRPDVKELTFWCRFWVLLAIVTALEYFLDPLLTWIPMYSEMKLALAVFLWHPRTLGADYVYDRFLVPVLSRHEQVIDTNLKDIQEQVQDVAVQLCSRALAYAQVHFMEFLAYLSSLSLEAARQAALQPDRQGLQDHPRVQEVDVDSDYTFVQREDVADMPAEDLRDVEPVVPVVARQSPRRPLRTLSNSRPDSIPPAQAGQNASVASASAAAPKLAEEVTLRKLRSRRKASGTVAQ